MAELDAKIVKQVEYYFGDVNLSKDKYLKNLIQNSTDGWVSFDEMLKFPRLKSLSEDKEIIKAAISTSQSKIIETSDDGIRRFQTLPLPDSFHETADKYLDQSIYVKGFNSKVTIDDIISYLEQYGGPTMNVHMRRIKKNNTFKGSVFAIFKEKVDAEKFLNNDEAATLNDVEMIRMWQKDYMESKKNEKKIKFDEKRKQQEEDFNRKQSFIESKMTKGALLELTGFPVISEGSERDEQNKLKTFLSECMKDTIAPVQWVDYFVATSSAIVRFNGENSATTALGILYNSKTGNDDNSAFKYGEFEIKGVPITGDQEMKYWSKIINIKSNRKNKGGSRGGPPNKRRRS